MGNFVSDFIEKPLGSGSEGIGSLLIGGALASMGIPPEMAAMITGGAETLATGDIGKGLMAGMGAYGGGSLYGGIANLGTGAMTAESASTMQAAQQGGIDAGISAAEDQSAAETARLAAANTAAAPTSDVLKAGTDVVKNDPKALYDQVGWKGAAAAAAPLLLSTAPKTNMPTGGAEPQGYIRQYYYDPTTHSAKPLTPVATKDWGNRTFESQLPYIPGQATGGIVALAHGGAVQRYDDGGYTSYTPEQINNYFAQNPGVDVAAATKQFNADPAAVAAAQAAASGISAAPVLAPAASTGPDWRDTSINNWLQTNPNATYQQMRDAAQSSGITDADIIRAYQNQGYSAADQNITLNPQWANAAGQTGYQGLNANINNWLAQYPTATKADALQAMLDSGLNNADVLRATGKTLDQLFAEKKQVQPPVVTPTATPGDVSTTGGGRTTDTYTGGVTTTPQTYAPAGTQNPYGNYINPGDLTLNADLSRTITPNTPGRPYGGFTGLGQVRDAYTAGGGNLGQVLKPTQDYTTSGGTKAAYDYLMGKGTWASTKPTTPQIQDTYSNFSSPTTAEKKQFASFHKVWRNGAMVDNPYYGYVDTPPAATTAPATTTTTTNTTADTSGAKAGGLMGAYAGGGETHYNLGGYSDGGRLLKGPGDGVSDSIPATIGGKQPARLADGEFVVPARIVSEIGNGSTEAGARKLYAMMDRVQAARRQTVGKGKVAKNTRADKYLPK